MPECDMFSDISVEERHKHKHTLTLSYQLSAIALLILICLVPAASFSKTIYVNNTKGMDWFDGFSSEWDGNHGPKRTIQAGINVSSSGDIVIVADGTYSGRGNRDISFLGKAIILKSRIGASNTIIECGGNENNQYRGFYFGSGEGPGSVLDGFTISNGYNEYGAGIYCNNAGPTIRNCVIINGRARLGAGILCRGAPVITNCEIIGNSADRDSGSHGGGIYCYFGSNVEISNCIIKDNSALGYGGGVFCVDSNTVITESSITGNTAYNGGGISCYDQANVDVANCTFVDNSADYGGGVSSWGSNFEIRNSIIVGNLSENGGGSFLYDQTDTLVEGCTFYGNTAPRAGGIYHWGRILIVNNSILWNNSQDEILVRNMSPSIVTYSDIKGGWNWRGGMNIDANPMFVDPGYRNDDNWILGDYHLRDTSPCINRGNPYFQDSDQADIDDGLRVLDSRVDIGADEFNVLGRHTLTTLSGPGGYVLDHGEGNAVYDHGTVVLLKSIADPGYRFLEWTGTGVNEGLVANPFSPITAITLNSDCTVKANFISSSPTKGLKMFWEHSSGDIVYWLINTECDLESGGEIGTTSSDWELAAVGDISGDGTDDLIWRSAEGDISCWILSPGGYAVSGCFIGNVTPDWRLIGMSDIDGDGNEDLIWRHTFGIVAYWLLEADGTRKFTGSIGNVHPNWTIESIIDIDGDSHADIIWRHETGEIAFWMLNSDGTCKSSGTIGSVSSGWRLTGLGDINLDGHPDIIWHHITGILTFWLLGEDGGMIDGGNIGSVSTIWELISVNDIDGDGTADLLWHNSYGDVTYWLLDQDGKRKSGGSIGTVSDQWTFRGCGR